MADRVGAHELGSTITSSASTTASTTSDHLAAGVLIADRYEIIRLIDRGGMGAVYEALDRSLQQRVALKTIRSERAYEPRAIERFKREASLARRVTHRNVCRVFDVGHHANEVFLTMELLGGETLAQRLRRDGALSPAAALRIVEQIVAALEAAHRAGVVHRDLKCSNVMLVEDRVVVTDFGLAHDVMASGHESSTDGFIGSPAYVAPEQVNGRHVSSASDIYALGVVMFEMVTGTLPWVGATPMATAVMRLHEPAPSPRERVPELAAAWEHTIARCLQLEPADRFAAIGDVLAGLRSNAPLVAKPMRRTRARVLAMATLAAVGIGGGIYALERNSPNHVDADRAQRALPGNPIAAGLYREALVALKQFQPAIARRELESALVLEPRQPLLYAALAKALHALQADEKERQVARVAFELSTDLDQETRLDIEASYRESVHEWAAAAKLRSALATFFPDNLDYGLALVEAQRRATQTDDALATIARLRRLAPPDRDDPRLDVAEARVRATADPAAAYALLDHAIIDALARGAAGVEADARLLVCNLRGMSLQLDAATKQCNAALAIYEAEHDLSGQAGVYAKLAGLNITARRPAEIEKYASRAMDLYKQVGSRSGELGVKTIFALAYRRAGDDATAEKLWREAVAGYRDAGEIHLMIKAMDDLAAVLTDQNKQDAAIPVYREVIRVAHDNGLTNIEANSLSNFSMTLTTRGELAEAAQLAADAVAKWKQLGQVNDAVFAMDSMGQIALRQGRLADARAIEDEALATRVKLGWVGGPSRQNLANIDLEEGNFTRSAALAQKAVDEFHATNEPRSELYAHDVLVRALVEAGQLDQADAAAKRMSELSKQVGASRVTTTGAFSLLRAARGDAAGALAMLRDALVEDRRGADVDDELDHLGLVAEILVKHGAPAEARKALAEMRAKANAHGYTQVVHDADALQRRLK